jgi:hypothetical protein
VKQDDDDKTSREKRRNLISKLKRFNRQQKISKKVVRNTQ